MRWIFKPTPDSTTVESLSKELNINTDLATMLAQRNIINFDQAKTFFRPSVNDIHDPFLMKDMKKAVDRLTKAVDNNERILIYGDYDVDGTCSVSLVYGFLREFHQNIEYHIPDRYAEGYGVSEIGIQKAIDNGVGLIITLDCGIKAVDKIAKAQENGIDVIVCDHHLPGEILPPATAILDAKQKDCEYPFKELCGCGVGFKLLQAYSIQHDLDITKLFEYLDFVAVATSSDIVPMVGENRALVHFGIQKLMEDPRTGLKALMEVAGMNKKISVTDVVFGIGPRINAAGRMDHAHGAVDLLLSDDMEEAMAFAEKINANNLDRRKEDVKITTEALAMIEDNTQLQQAKSTVLYNENWHKGVIGIVASRCTEQYYRPTIILTESNGKATGSARSVLGFDVHQALTQCEDLLEQYGGHMYAAGLTLELDKINSFVEKFEKVVSESISDEQLIQQLKVDLEIPLSRINMKFFNIIQQMAPFGPLNLEPLFVTSGLKDTGQTRIVKEDHLKLSVTDGVNTIDGIAFGMAKHYDRIKKGESFSLCYHINENEFRGNVSLQLMVKDIKF